MVCFVTFTPSSVPSRRGRASPWHLLIPHLALAFHPQPGKLASHRSDAEQPDAPGRGLTHGDHHEREFAHHPPLPARRPGALLLAASAQAQTKLVVGYQLIVGPFLTAIADGSMDAALKDAGYQVDWRQFTSGGDISTALASGKVPVGVLGSTGITAAATRGVDLQLFWVLDNIGKSEALVAQRLGHRKHRRPEGQSASPRRSCRPRTSTCWSGWNRYGRFRRATCAS